MATDMQASSTPRVLRFVVPLVIVALLAAAAVVMLGGDKQKTIVAHFPRTVSVYEGSDVRVLGVPVGEVLEVEPSGTDVEVTLVYDADVKVPVDASAVIVAPAVVGDRYIQLTPAFSGGEVLADNTELGIDRTATPLELDQIYSSMDQFTVALGPNGANRDGALSDLLDQTARNFGGQGAAFHQTIEDFSQLSQTFDNNKEELFGSAAQLQAFLETLARNDTTVRQFNQSMAQVADMLAGERHELAASMKNLAEAMTQVSAFVKENRDALGRNIKGLNRVSKVLVKQRGALDEVLRFGPLALNNLALTYNPQAGTLDTRANLGEIGHQLESDPATFLCGVVNQADRSGRACDQIQAAFPRAGALGVRGGARQPALSDPSLGGLVRVEEEQR